MFQDTRAPFLSSRSHKEDFFFFSPKFEVFMWPLLLLTLLLQDCGSGQSQEGNSKKTKTTFLTLPILGISPFSIFRPKREGLS